MSQAEELLNGLSEEIPVHNHPVPDTDTYFVIDPITRKIENTNPKKHVIMQYDHNSERCTFELPRFIDGHDMLECTSVTVNVDNIEVVESDGVEEVEPRINSDAPDMTDLRLHPNDPEKVISSWLISRNSTQLAGILSFHIEYKCVDSNGNVVYEWSTDTFSDIAVKARKKNGEAAVAGHSDLLEQWRTRIFGAGDSVMANIAAEGEVQVAAVKAESETQQEAVELKGAETLDSIPEDYTEVDAMADEAVRSKGDAIVCEAAGEFITLKDSSDDHIRGLKVFGKTTQVATTGAQLANLPDAEIELGGIKWACKNGVVTAVGTCNAESSSTGNSINHSLTGQTGTFHVSGNSNPVKVYIRVRKNGTEKWYNDTTFTLDGTEEDVLFYMQVADVGTVVNTTLYPMLNTGDVALPWEPYTGGKPSPSPEWPQELLSIENPTTIVYGRNLVDIRQLVLASNKSFTISEDGYTITLVGGSDKTYAYSHYDIPTEVVYALRGKKIRLSSDFISKSVESAYSPVQMNIKCEDNTFHYPVNHPTKLYHEFIIPHNAVEIRFGIYTNNSNTLLESDNTVVVKGVRLTLADNTAYESYKPIEILGVNRTLPGIPVTSGGNYTDENGQQWICDEVDLERGVYVRRIEQYVYDGSEDENWKNGYSSNGKNNRFELILMGVPVAHEVCESNNAAFVAKNAYCSHFDYQRTSTRPDVNNFRISKSVTAVQDWWYMLFVPDTTIVPLEDLDAWKTYLADHPMTVMIPLRTPIETPLTAEEITAFKALRTNYPNTTILNDAGAWMSVKYNADTKSYVENPRVLKLTDSSTGVVYELKIVDGNITVVPV